MAAAIAALAIVTIGWARPVGGTDSDETQLTSVQFDLVDLGGSPTAPAVAESGDGSSPLGAITNGPSARYRTVTVRRGAENLVLRPVDGPVRLTADADQLATMTANRNGAEVGHAADGFIGLLADAATSTAAESFVRVGSYAGGQPVELNLFYGRALGSDDYLLVQEAGGDASVEVTPIDATGTAIGPGRLLGPGYQWNTGHGPADEPTSWASAVSVVGLLERDQPVAGLRISTANAQVKALALTAAPEQQTATAPTEDLSASPVDAAVTIAGEAPPSQADTADSSAAATAAPTDPIGQAEAAAAVARQPAAVGLETTIQPAIVVGGTGCVGAPATDPTSLTPGQAATYCFTVTNLGAGNLTNLAITDELLGLADAVLPRAAGPDVLKPGEQAVFYYHSVLTSRPAGAISSVTATVVDSTGAPAGVATPIAAPAGDVLAAGSGPAAGSPPPAANQALPEAAPAPQATVADAASLASSAISVTEAAPAAVTQLAMTGMPSEPWVLMVLAMGLIFIGYTAYAAFQRRNRSSEPCGHDQLDSLGFE